MLHLAKKNINYRIRMFGELCHRDANNLMLELQANPSIDERSPSSIDQCVRKYIELSPTVQIRIKLRLQCKSEPDPNSHMITTLIKVVKTSLRIDTQLNKLLYSNVL